MLFWPRVTIDQAAARNGRRDGGLSHPADGSESPPAEKAFSRFGNYFVHLLEAGQIRELGKVEANLAESHVAVDAAAARTTAARTALTQAQRDMKETEEAGSIWVARLRYCAAQVFLGAADAYALSLSYYVLAGVGRMEALGMAVCLAFGLGLTADWYGSGASKRHPLLRCVAVPAVALVFASTAYIRAMYFTAPGTLINGVPAVPWALAAVFAGIGGGVFVCTMVASTQFHDDLSKRKAWARVSSRVRNAERRLADSEADELAAKKRNVRLEVTRSALEGSQQQTVQAWRARFKAVVVHVYRAAFLRATGDGRPRPWMVRDPVDRREGSKGTVVDVGDNSRPSARVETTGAPTRNGNGNGFANGVTAALLMGTLALNACGIGSNNKHGVDRVVLFDVSDNSWPGTLRSNYLAAARHVTGSLEKGDCLAFDVIRRRPDDQIFPVSACLARDTDNPMVIDQRRDSLSASLPAQVDSLLHSAQRTPASPLVEAIAATPHRLAVHAAMAHEVVIVTDGVQQSDLVDLARNTPTATYVDSALAALRHAGGIPDLHGARLKIAIVGGEYDRLPQERRLQVKAFWVKFTQAANAVMDPDADYGSITGS